MKILSNLDFLSFITGFEVNENVQFRNSHANNLNDFVVDASEGTYFEDDETTYYKVRNTSDDCIVFDENEDVY